MVGQATLLASTYTKILKGHASIVLYVAKYGSGTTRIIIIQSHLSVFLMD